MEIGFLTKPFDRKKRLNGGRAGQQFAYVISLCVALSRNVVVLSALLYYVLLLCSCGGGENGFLIEKHIDISSSCSLAVPHCMLPTAAKNCFRDARIVHCCSLNELCSMRGNIAVWPSLGNEIISNIFLAICGSFTVRGFHCYRGMGLGINQMVNIAPL